MFSRFYEVYGLTKYFASPGDFVKSRFDCTVAQGSFLFIYRTHNTHAPKSSILLEVIRAAKFRHLICSFIPCDKVLRTVYDTSHIIKYVTHVHVAQKAYLEAVVTVLF